MLDLFNFADPGEIYAVDVLSIDYAEFSRAIRKRIGYQGPEAIVRQVFRSLDLDIDEAVPVDVS